ncbi:MAG: Calx-beta domain-containing protein [Povalibacter sp.]
MKRSQQSVGFALLCSFLFLSACGDDGESVKSTGIDSSPSTGGTGSVPAGAAGRVQFDASAINVAEAAGQVAITVTRTDGSQGALTVTVSSRNGSATQAEDYTAVSTTVAFADGDTAPKTVNVSIINDAKDEADETLYVTLSSSVAGTLGATSEALITITDDDLSAPSAPKAAMTSAYKHLHVDWTSVAGANSYRLLKDALGDGNFAQLGTDLPSSTHAIDFDVTLLKEDWTKTRYAVAACNTEGCSRSNSMSLAGLSTPLIGYLKDSESRADEQFGTSVAISADGNTLAVGARDGGATSNVRTGSVSIFTRSGTNWSFMTKLVSANAEDDDSFGTVIGLSADGSCLVVGAADEDSLGADPTNNAAISAGAAYVFERTESTWAQTAYLKASDPEQYAMFGTSVAISRDATVIAVGAPYKNSGLLTSQGAVYVFNRGTAATWIPRGILNAPVPASSAYFGVSVAMNASGSLIAVGAYGEDVTALDFAGRVHLFSRATNSWIYQNSINAPTPAGGAAFGTAVALDASGTTLAVSASSENAGGSGPTDPVQYYVGAAYIFDLSGSTSTFAARLIPANAAQYDAFGTALSLSNDGHTLAATSIYESGGSVGLDGAATEEQPNSGAAYVFSDSSGSWKQRTYVKASNTHSADTFGAAVAVDATGNTLVVSAPDEQSAAESFNGNQLNDCDSSAATNCAKRSGGLRLLVGCNSCL